MSNEGFAFAPSVVTRILVLFEIPDARRAQNYLGA
jgi:hypothetical protein